MAEGRLIASARDAVDAALKAVVLPHLRAMGFKGSLPHLHRLRGAAADLLTVQFISAGGKFVVELGRAAPGGFDSYGRHIPIAKAKTYYLAERHRLGSEMRVNYGDHWFSFAEGDPETVAREVCALLDDPALWAFIDTLAVLE
ncbi:MAG: DUF4304 domain-containing protein [Erythrobacter sp.]